MPGQGNDKENNKSGDIYKYAVRNGARRRSSVTESNAEAGAVFESFIVPTKLFYNNRDPDKGPAPLTAAKAPETGTLKLPDRATDPKPSQNEEPMLTQLLKRFRQCTIGSPGRSSAPTLEEIKTTYGKASKKDLVKVIMFCSQWICKGADYAIDESEEQKDVDTAERLWKKWSQYNVTLSSLKEAPETEEPLEEVRKILADAFADIETYFEVESGAEDGIPTLKPRIERILNTIGEKATYSNQNAVRSKLQLRLEQCFESGDNRVSIPTLDELKTTYGDASEQDLNHMIQACAKGFCAAAEAGAVSGLDCSSPGALYKKWNAGKITSQKVADNDFKDALQEILIEAFKEINAFIGRMRKKDAVPEVGERSMNPTNVGEK